VGRRIAIGISRVYCLAQAAMGGLTHAVIGITGRFHDKGFSSGNANGS